jgi:hypothetical protein
MTYSTMEGHVKTLPLLADVHISTLGVQGTGIYTFSHPTGLL